MFLGKVVQPSPVFHGAGKNMRLGLGHQSKRAGPSKQSTIPRDPQQPRRTWRAPRFLRDGLPEATQEEPALKNATSAGTLSFFLGGFIFQLC